MKKWRFALLASLAAGAFNTGDATAQEVTFRVVTGTPRNFVQNAPLLKLIERINERGKGKIRLQYLGGPEATPVEEQYRAVSSGVIDLLYAPNQYFQGAIPESQAFNASNRTAMELRANGALTAVNKAYNDKGKIQLLGYFGSGYQFVLYLRDEPKRLPDGSVDFRNLRIRGTGTYREFYDGLGIILAPVQIGEIYTALERGTVDGIGWVTLALTDFSLQKFLKRRILPRFWQGDLGLVANLEEWNRLTPELRQLIIEEVAKSEEEAHAFNASLSKQEEVKIREAGIKDIQLPPAQAKTYLDLAFGSRWKEMARTIGNAEAERLKALFLRSN